MSNKPGDILFLSKDKKWRIIQSYATDKSRVWQNSTDCNNKGHYTWINTSLVPETIWSEYDARKH